MPEFEAQAANEVGEREKGTIPQQSNNKAIQDGV
jgi:hypothetical protein